MIGKFIGIGVGPGAPDLLTLRAVKALQSLDVLIVPAGRKEGRSEAQLIVSEFLSDEIQIVQKHFPMTSDFEDMMKAIRIIAQEVEPLIESGKTVGFVTLGDPMLYSTYIYLLNAFEAAVPIETIPGISSYSAIASGLCRPLAEGDTPLLIYPCTGDMGELSTVLDTHEAIVLMKVYKSFETVRFLLKEKGLLPYTVAVSNYGKPEQEVHTALDQVDSEAISYFTTLLINKRYTL